MGWYQRRVHGEYHERSLRSLLIFLCNEIKIKTNMSNDNSCKLLVRKLDWSTTEEELKEFYSKFGSVEDATVVKNKDTGKSRGFGFIRFVKASMVDDAMESRPHEIGGRKVEPHRSAPKEYSERVESHHTCNEIYIGKMVEEIDEDDLREYFGQYGNIEKIAIPKGDDGKFRGFAVITYDDYDPVDVTCYKRAHSIKDKRVFVSKYIKKDKLNELKERYGGGKYDNGFSSNGFGDFDGALQSMLLQKVLGMGSGGGPMRGRRFGGGGGKPYGGRGRRN